MFGLFNKKVSFIDIWRGTPEIHCHVLPGIDDGAKDPIATIQLLEKYRELGCSRVIATPHTMGGIYDNTEESIKNAFGQIDVPAGLSLSYSSEYMLDETFDNLLSSDQLIPLSDNYLLIEMSYFQPPENLKEIIYKIGLKGYIPVMAHPERYAYYHNRTGVIEEFKRMGCLLQLNALSLSKHYGESVQKAAYSLLSNNIYDFIGIDTHRIDHLEKLTSLEIPKKFENQLNTICKKTKDIFDGKL